MGDINTIFEINFRNMIVKINKGMDKEAFDEALKKIKPTRILMAHRHLGKVKWKEDALAFQKRMRDDWK